MKNIIFYSVILSIALSGCGKNEEPATEAADTAATAQEQTAEQSTTAAKTAESLVASGTDAVEKAVADVKKSVQAELPKVDFSNMSWDKVSSVPFDQKSQLAGWATERADSWKSKLADAASGQGLNMLSKMGDSGWQGALKKVMESINAVRESSPETYEMARGALVSAWTTFEKQASAILE